MKVAVVTRHAVANYGSLLQAIATQTVIEKMGHTCQIINYIRKDESYERRELTILKRKPNWNASPVKRLLYLALRQPGSILVGRKFEKAQAKYLNLTRRYNSYEELIGDKPKADIYLTGSDQVWGPTEDGSYDSCYCLSFTEDSDKRIAYAASFGRMNLTEEPQEFFKKWLHRYHHIALREDSAVELVSKMGIAAEQVIDPTLLLSKEEWLPYVGKAPQKDYILIYQLHNDKRLNKYAKKVSKETGLPLIRISASAHQFCRGGAFCFAPDLGTFLAYIKGATCLITDSFHGTAFAINFNTQFVEVLPNNGTHTRNLSILTMTGLEDRILRDLSDVSLATKKQDYSRVNEILKQQREHSYCVLKKMIEDEGGLGYGG